MKKFLTTAVFLMLSATSHAGVIGWFTSDARDWDFVQRTGGIRISEPIQKEGKTLLPVEYDVSGLSAVTRKPTLMNSGLMVRKIEAKREQSRIIIHVVTQVVEKGKHAGPVHYADLNDPPPGKYQVCYQTCADTEKVLGEIEIGRVQPRP